MLHSVSTATTDKRKKRINYQTIDSLREYILVYQNQMKVEVYRQDDQGNWSTEVLGTDDKLHLESVNLTLTMADVYKDVVINTWQYHLFLSS
jgi:Uma2 family endonuclease